MSKKEVLEELILSIVNLDVEGTMKSAQEALDAGISAYEIIMKGMARGMEIVGKKYEQQEYFLSELVVAGEAMKAGVAILEPHLKAAEAKSRGKVVIGTVKGDLHDIGKNIVVAMLTGAGFKVYDLGVDIPPEKFVKKAKEVDADIVAMSGLLTTTIPEMKTVVEALKKAGIRDRVKVLVGGRSVTPEFAKKIGADAYAENAMKAIKVAKGLMGDV